MSSRTSALTRCKALGRALHRSTTSSRSLGDIPPRERRGLDRACGVEVKD